MKKIIQLGIFLGIICIISSGALYYTNSITAPVIAKNQKDATDKLLKQIVSDADEFETEELNTESLINVYFAMKDENVTDTIYEVSAYGFQSDVKVLVAINNESRKFSGFQVIEQAETPGYGTQIQTSKKYQGQFTTKSIDDEVDTIAGSTVTTSALKGAIDEAVAHFKENNK